MGRQVGAQSARGRDHRTHLYGEGALVRAFAAPHPKDKEGPQHYYCDECHKRIPAQRIIHTPDGPQHHGLISKRGAFSTFTRVTHPVIAIPAHPSEL